MSAFARSSRILPVLAAVAVSAGAQAVPDLTGTWDITMTAVLGQLQTVGRGEVVDCTFQGVAVITDQTGAEVFGDVDVTLTQGVDACPAEMMANISGAYGQGTLSGMLMGGQLGEATFSGTPMPAVATGAELAPRDAPAGTTFGGTYDVTVGGPFGSTSGTWSAVARGAAGGPTIPTLGGIGLTLLTLLIMLGGGLLLYRGAA